MSKRGFTIWRKSIIENNYRCECGALIIKDGRPYQVVGQVFGDPKDPDGEEIEIRICSECDSLVGFHIVADVTEEEIMRRLGTHFESAAGRRLS